MGWLEVRYTGSRSAKDLDAFFDKDNGWAPEVNLLGTGSVVGSAYYRPIEVNGKKLVFVALVHFSKKNGTICYKTMSDADGPTVTTCPRRILDLVGGVDGAVNQWGREWRQACYDAAGSTKGLRNGDIVEFEHPLFFSEWSCRRFLVRKEYLSRTATRKSTYFVVYDGGEHNGIPCRIKSWRKMSYKVVG